MATQFQNRLIGTVILVSLGVIFLPDLLMGKKNDIAAPAGSIPLRPEQSLASHQNETTVGLTASAAQNNTTTAVSGSATTGVVVANNTAATTMVSAATSAKPAVNTNEQWKVEEVAAPVTITETGVVSDKVESVATEKQQATELAKAKARELEQKKKDALAVAKAKELAKIRETAFENKKEIESKPVVEESEVRTTETIAAEPQMTVKRDESGLTIKTPAQVEAERAASKSSSSTSFTTTPKPAASVAHSGSWIIQVGVFSNAENAQALAAKLRSAGYGASAQRSGQLTRVMVGPDVSKDKLQAMLSNINRVGGTSARVVAYSAVGN
ncbi:MAG: SPOR domain-containing protein [Tolumonas sp.]|nr:SPOR domain-containing protein [Tolumonas sp.]